MSEPLIGELDVHLINEGRHEQLWDALGAQVSPDGTAFRVWAPRALEVQVRGDFNGWDGASGVLTQVGTSGVWETFVPGVGSGASYKFHIRGADGVWRDKADPMAFWTEVPPATASRVFESKHTWTDDEWMTQRAAETRQDQQPMSVYEVHLGSWRKHEAGGPLTYDELADELTAYVVEMGFTHVELLPVMEHPFGGSWGYQVTSYYAPTSRFGDPDGFRRLVQALHNAGIGVIVDWVPAHFPKDEFALARFDGTPLYEDPNPSRGEHPDWGTFVFNFGRKEVRNFLVANALYWLEEFHIDGIRVDAVASMLYLDYSREAGEWQPNVHGGRENLEAVHFLKELNGTIYKRVPGAITIAEESTSWPGVTQPTSADGLGFGFKWNMGWMHDSLEYVARDPIHRGYHHNQLTFSMVYAFSENYVLPISHDEVVHGKGSLLRKMPGDRWQQLASVRAFLSWQWAHPGQAAAVHGSGVRAGQRVGRAARARLAPARRPGPRRRESSGRRPEQRVRRQPGAVVAGLRRRGLRVAQRRRRRPQHGRVPALGLGRQPARLRDQLLRDPARGLRAGPSVRRRVDRGDQHRRRDLRRLRCRQPRHGHRPRDATRRPARLRAAARAPARHALAHQPAALNPALALP